MRVDAHHHVWKLDRGDYGWLQPTRELSKIYRDFTLAELRSVLGEADIDTTVLVQAAPTVAETRYLLEVAKASRGLVRGVVGWVDLRSPRLRATLESLSGERKFVGVRHIVQSEADEFLLRPDFLYGISQLEEFNLAYDILIYAKHLPIATEFVSRFPRQSFVLDHLAKPQIKSGAIDLWARGIRELASFSNVYAKLSGLVTEAHWHGWKPADIQPYLDVAFDCFGSRRLMIGSDWPVCNVAASYQRTMGMIEDYLKKFPIEEREAVLGGNAARFWRLPRGA